MRRFYDDKHSQTMSGQSTAGAFIPLIHSQLAELKKQCGGFGHRKLRDAIAAAEVYLQSVNSATENVSLEKSLEPFFTAMREKKRGPFQLTVLDCFFKVFKQATPELSPSRELTQKIVSVLIKVDKNNSDDLNLLICNTAIACLRSCSGVFFCHGKLLRQMFRLLFKIYNNCENVATMNSIKTSINETLLALFDSYMSPPALPQTEDPSEFATQMTNGIVQNTMAIQQYLGDVLDRGDFTPTIRDVDMFVVIGLFARIVEKNKMKTKTICLAAEFLVSSLKQKCEFFQKRAFRVLLETQVNVTFLSLALDMREALAPATAELLLVLWRDFAPIYNEGLNNFLVKGLATTLTSPDPVVLARSLSIYAELAKHPQFFVDAFVNYDCDESGYFGNVFENTMDLLVKLSYPDVPVQRKAIEVIVAIFGSLWSYFKDFRIEDDKPTEKEAPQNFLEAKRTKNVFAEGIEIFKKSFKKGMIFFKEHNFVEDDPKKIASFLFNTPALDPGEVGQLLGDSRQVEVLKCFASLFDFRGLTFEQAFRQFLQKFQIPGEAQMIDRVMEQFGTKFYNDNSNMFSCADTVYVLAFSALMLHTDAHHPNVKSRMTLEQFLANNKGIDGGRDLPVDFLTELYKGITTKRIYLSNASNQPSSALLTRAQKADLYRNKCKQTITEARQESGTGRGNQHIFHRSVSPLFIGPMFDAVWRGALAVLTMSFQNSNDPEMYKMCLEGLSYSVHIASHCFIETALDTLVDSFGTFTGLRRGLREAKEKNIACTNALIEIAYEDRNFLRGAWEIVMGELSALDKLNSTSIQVNYNTDVVDMLFATTQELDRESIVDFTKAMCKISTLELAEDPARLFLLEKMNIVCNFNMNRPRYIWLTIWDEIGKHLQTLCCSQSVDLAYIGINMMRQLGQKFLEQPELTQFHFQQHFMAPFSYIYGKQVHVDAKDYLLENISGLMKERAEKLQSGWYVIIEILLIAATEPTAQKRAFDILSIIINNFLDILSERYTDIITIMCSFCSNAEVEIRKKAVEAFVTVASKIPQKFLDVWTILLDGLGRVGQDVDDGVRRKAHEAFLTIGAGDQLLSDEIMDHCFKESLPQFFDGRACGDGNEFYATASEFQTKLFESLIKPNWDQLSDFFEPIVTCVCKNITIQSNVLTKSSIETLSSFITPVFVKLTESQKEILFRCLSGVADKINEFSIPNGKFFITTMESMQENSDGEQRFIDVLKVSDKRCEETKSWIVWASNRSSLLRVQLRFGTALADDIAETLTHTLQTFLETEFPANTSGDDSLAWNQSAVVSIEMLNNMPGELFIKCFDATCDQLLELINAVSIEVRKQVNIAVQRKLL